MAGSDGNDVSASDLQFSSHALFIQRALVSVLLPIFCFAWLYACICMSNEEKNAILKKNIFAS
jgi:hypothetical protein